MTVAPAPPQIEDGLAQRIGTDRIEPGEGFVEDQEFGLGDHRGDELHPLGHAFAQRIDAAIGAVRQVEPRKPGSDFLAHLAPAAQFAEELQQGAHPHLAVKAAFLGEVSNQVISRAGHLVAQHADLPPVGIEDIDDHADRGRLPAAIGTDKTEDAAFGNAEGEVIHGGDLAESLGDA